MNGDDSSVPGIVNNGPVYTATQHGTGYVGAMGPDSRGIINVDTARATVIPELQDLIERLRAAVEQHRTQVTDPEPIIDTINLLDSEVHGAAQPGRIRNFVGILAALARPVAALGGLINRIQESVDRLRS